MEPIKLKLLHIEDDDGDAKLVKRHCLKEFGVDHCTLVRVNTMSAALAALNATNFSVILLDLHLGDGQGLENLRIIKDLHPDTPIVVLSGHDSTNTALEAIRGGAQEYLVKSYSNSRILGLALLSSIERKAYERKLYQLATHDELTGLYNRRAFEEYLQKCLIRAERWESTECIMFLDVNGFKYINDTLGHEVGDELLKHIALTLKKGLRDSDMLARYAGDEFVIHLDAQSSNAKEVSMKVVNNITRLFENPVIIGTDEIKVGLSIGIAFFPEHGGTCASLIKSSDIAMYKAKKSKVPFVLL